MRWSTRLPIGKFNSRSAPPSDLLECPARVPFCNSATRKDKEKELQPPQNLCSVHGFRHAADEVDQHKENEKFLFHNSQIEKEVPVFQLKELAEIYDKQRESRRIAEAFDQFGLVQRVPFPPYPIRRIPPMLLQYLSVGAVGCRPEFVFVLGGIQKIRAQRSNRSTVHSAARPTGILEVVA